MGNVTVQKDDAHKYSRGLLYMREKKFSGPGEDASVSYESVPILPTTLARLVVMPDGKTVNEAISETDDKIGDAVTNQIQPISNKVTNMEQTLQTIENKVTNIENNGSGAKIKTFDTMAEYQAAQSGGQIQPGEIVVIKG